MNNPQRPEVDDPRVLALAKARQQIAYSSPINFVCPPWDGLTEQEQQTSLLDARNYLHAAIAAGLVAVPPATTDRAALRDRIAKALHEARRPGLGGMTEADAVAYMADAVLAVLPAGSEDATTTRAAVTPPPALTEAGRLRAQVEVLQQDAERDRGLAKVGARCMREGHQGLIEQGRAVIEGWRFALSVALDLGTGAPWEAIHERVKELRRLAAETQPSEPTADDMAPLAKVARWVTSQPVTANTEFGNGYRECQRDIRDLLGGRFDYDPRPAASAVGQTDEEA